MPSRNFDLVVIGSGSAGGTVATGCRRAGWSVALVEAREVGGTCALRGCDPKKVLVAAAAAVDAARSLEGRGVRPGTLAIDWPALQQFKRTFTEPHPARRTAALEAQGIVLVRGTARFVGPDALDVDGERLTASRAIVVATGARPAPLPMPGADLLATSDDFLDLTELPTSIVFVGGGFIAFEFAHVAARAGARVTILERERRALPGFEPELVDVLVERTRALGVDVRLGAAVRAISRAPAGLRVDVDGESGGEAVEAALAVHGAGRVPDIDALDCPAGKVEAGRRGIRVDAHLRSPSNPHVYAAGDCADSGGPPLTPVAGYEGRVIVEHLLGRGAPAVDHQVIPSAVFTLPPLARVGLGEAEARAAGHDVEVHAVDTSGWYSSRRVGAAHSRAKLLVERGSRRVIGAHLLGPHADELINVFALAMRQGATADDLAGTLWAYPTHGSDVPSLVR